MGIAGAGNSGTLLATLFAPRLAERFGWAATFGLAMLPVVAGVRRSSRCSRKDSPAPRAPTTLARLRRGAARAATRCGSSFLYSLTFGGFVGFASFLTTFFHEQYQRVARDAPATSRRWSSWPAASCVRSAAGCRIASAATGCSSCCSAASRVCLVRRRDVPPLPVAVARAVRRRWALLGHGQRRGVPARAAALSRIASASSPASSAPPAGSADSSCRQCSARSSD